MQDTSDLIEAPTGRDERSLEKLRGAMADLLRAVSSAFRDNPEEAYGYMSRAVALLVLESPGAIAGLDRCGAITAAPAASRGGLAPWQIRKVSTFIETHL